MSGPHTIASVELNLGLVTASVRVHSGLEKEGTGLRTLCTGGGKHAPAPIFMSTNCPIDGPLDPAQVEALVKGVASGDGWKVVTKDEIATVRQGVDALKQVATITPHPVAQVETSTLAGEKLYYLTPKSNESRYALIRDVIAAHPELAFMLQWVPRSTPSTYRVTVAGEVLVMEERVENDRSRPLPEVEAVANPTLLGPVNKMVTDSVADFDPTLYANRYATALQELFESREATPGMAPTGTTKALPHAGDDYDLLAKLAAAEVTSVKAAPKRTTRRKTNA